MMDPRLRDLVLVAHRGFPRDFPENTLTGYDQAVAHGARYVETDVQLTRDGVPVLHHDGTTRRLSGTGGSIMERTLDEIRVLDARYPARFGDRFAGTPIAGLSDFADWLARHPEVLAFIEIKKESVKAFGVEPVVASVMSAIDTVKRRCVIISFDDRCVAHAAEHYGVRTGWVLRKWSRKVEDRARGLAPDYLFADHELIPGNDTDIWHGPWQWAVYVINDLARALAFVERGIHIVETDAIGDMMDQYRAGYLLKT